MSKAKRIQLDKLGQVADIKAELSALSAKLVEKNIITAQEKEDLKPVQPVQPIEPIKK